MLIRPLLRPVRRVRPETHAERRRRGFTLMELLVVVAILLVLVGVATPMYLSYLEQSKLRVAKAECIRIAGEIRSFAVLHTNDYPQTGGFPPPEAGLQPLIPSIFKREPLDPWNNQYYWMLDNSNGTLDPIVFSRGPNGIEGDADDISSD